MSRLVRNSIVCRYCVGNYFYLLYVYEWYSTVASKIRLQENWFSKYRMFVVLFAFNICFYSIPFEDCCSSGNLENEILEFYT